MFEVKVLELYVSVYLMYFQTDTIGEQKKPEKRVSVYIPSTILFYLTNF